MNEDYSVTLKNCWGRGRKGHKGDKMTRKLLIKTASAGAGIDTAPRRALASTDEAWVKLTIPQKAGGNGKGES